MPNPWTISLCLLSLSALSNAAEKPVTNEEIRNAMLGLAQSMRTHLDKLERHELRERHFSEYLKKTLANIEKRQRPLEPIKGTLSRLDERLASVETILLQKDEREKIQTQKTTNAIEDINTTLQTWMAKLEKIIMTAANKTPPEVPKTDNPLKLDLKALRDELSTKVDSVLTKEEQMNTKADKILSVVDKLNGEILKVHEDSKNMKQLNEKSVKNLDQVEGQLKNNEQLLGKYVNHLEELSNKISPIETQPEKQEPDWQPSFLSALDTQRTQLEKILHNIKTVEAKIHQLPEAKDISTKYNTTLEALQDMRHDISAKADKSASKVNTRLSEIEKKLNENQEEVVKSVQNVGTMSEHGLLDLAKGNEKLHQEVQSLSKVEKVMIQTADNVLDTKRRIEYGVHQILLEVGDLVKIQSKDINTMMNNRFDNIELTILDNQTGALANLSSKLEQEMSQVWRQIGIMYQQLTVSTTALDRLQGQTEAYLNGSLSTMDSMEGKVGQITGRMAEVDSNLNYLLGRLSLITQEFNQIKIGLGNAIDDIHGTFKMAQDKLKDKGPGPHNIKDEGQNSK